MNVELAIEDFSGGGGGGEKLGIRLNSAQLELELGLSLATRKPYSFNSYRLKSNKFICCDATYNLNWLNYPVFVVGTASPTGKFRICLVAISSHEDHIAQMKILNFVKSIGATPSFLMGRVII